MSEIYSTRRGITPQEDPSSATNSTTFEMGEANLFLSLNQARKVVIPPPVNPKLFFADPETLSSGLGYSLETNPVKALVVILRNISVLRTDNNNNEYSPSHYLKSKLREHQVGSYSIPIPVVMKDLQAIQVMKGYTAPSIQNDGMDDYMRLVLAIVDHKMTTKRRKVIIIDLGDETTIRHLPLKDFCLRSHAEVHTFDVMSHDSNESLEPKLDQLTKKLLRRLKEFRWIKDLEEGLSEKSNDDDGQLFHRPKTARSHHAHFTEEMLGLADMQTEILPVPETPTTVILDENENDDDDADWTYDSQPDSEASVSEEEQEPKIEIINVTRSKSKDSNSVSCTEDDMELNANVSLQNQNLPKKKPRGRRKIDVNLLSDPRYRRDLQSSPQDSEKSIKVSQLCARRPRLLKIQKMPHESKHSHAMFSRFPNPVSKRPSYVDDEYLYKGWVAVPATKEDLRRQRKSLELGSYSKFRRFGNAVFKRVKSFVTCDTCCESQTLRTSPTSGDYPAILLNSSAFEQRH